MRIEPFHPVHVLRMSLQAHQLSDRTHATGDYLMRLKRAGPAYTAFYQDHPIASAGIAYDGERHTLWGFFDRSSGRHMLVLVRWLKRFLELCGTPAVESMVKEGFDPGCRFLELLGFKRREPQHGYGPGGETFIRYVRS